MKTIQQQIIEGKTDIVVHLNGDTLKNLAEAGVDLNQRWHDVFKAIINVEYVGCIVEKKGESLKAVMQSIGLNNVAELKALLKAQKEKQ